MTEPSRSPTTCDEERATSVLMLAFSADPAVRWVWPDPRQYLEDFPSFARAFGGRAFTQGTAYCLPGYVGAALWLPPGIGPDEDAIVDLFKRSTTEKRQAEVFEVLEQMGRYHPTEPHWYLPLIGVDPSRQGEGLGAELMRPVLATCDRDGLPAYLESSNARNVPFYERLGFEVLGTIQSGGSPELYPMLRKVRG
jgi:GNAT superfamily N-acetyltransferase